MSKKHCLYNTSPFLCLIFIFGLFLLCISACEPGLPIKVENNTEQILSIYVNDYHQFDIEPGKVVKKRTVPMVFNHYIIEARNSEEEVVYSKTINLEELGELINKGIEIKIPAQ